MPPKRSTRAAKKVKRESAATEADIDDALQSGDTFEQVFGGYSGLSDDQSDASDVSGYFGRRKPPVKKRVIKQAKPPSRKLNLTKKAVPKAPEAQALSENEYDSDSDTGYGLSMVKFRPRTPLKPGREASHNTQASVNTTVIARQDQSIPNVLQIHVNGGSESGGSTVNVDLTPLLNAHKAGTTLTISPNNDDTLVGDDNSNVSGNSSAVMPSLRMQRLNDARARATANEEVKKTGFTDLPAEVRVRVYRSVFVTKDPINFHTRQDFKRSSAFLRTCKIAHEEGRAVLYGENAFHFERSHSTRGKFFEDDWREIGFKDVRRFLETIGNTNVSMMRYISFEFADATKSYSPTEEIERRFVNDPVVLRCLGLIGSNTHLAKFAFTFSGRRQILRTDLHFLRALTSIKSQEVVNVASYGGGYKVKPDLIIDIKKLMVVRLDDPNEVDDSKKKNPTVVMHHERNRGTRFWAACR
jgi:hypothetical protein